MALRCVARTDVHCDQVQYVGAPGDCKEEITFSFRCVRQSSPKSLPKSGASPNIPAPKVIRPL